MPKLISEMGKERKWKETKSLIKVKAEKNTALGTGQPIDS
jgi:hypothetical protein